MEEVRGSSRSDARPCPPARPRRRSVRARARLVTTPPPARAAARAARVAQPRLVVGSPGDGLHFAGAGDTVYFHYDGFLADGTLFDSSHGKAPFSFVQGSHSVIACFEEAAAVMSPGESAELFCPAAYAYGERGQGGAIPPNAPLRFQLQLIKVEPPSFWGTLWKAGEQGMPALQSFFGAFGGGAGPGSAGAGAALPGLSVV
jgi:FK506-binding protein 1